MQQLVAYWVGVGFRALESFPEFLGSNWVGFLLSALFLVPRWKTQLRDYLRTKPAALGWRSHANTALTMAARTNWRTVGVILACFFAGNVLKVAYSDQRDLAHQNGTLRSMIQQKDGQCEKEIRETRSSFDSRIKALNEGNAAQKSALSVLQRQVDSQRNIIDNFGTQLIKATVEPLKVTPIGFDIDNSNTARKKTR